MPRVDGRERWRGVWVLVEHRGGRPGRVSWELLGAARGLADDLGAPLAAVVLGHRVEHLAREVGACCADLVYLADAPVLADYRVEAWSRVLAGLVERERPEIFLVGATPLGRELAGVVATLTGAGLTADCTGLDVDPGTRLLQATRPTFGGRQLATIVCADWRPQMATVRPRVFGEPDRLPGREAEIRRVPVDFGEADLASRLLEAVRLESEETRLETASVVVAGGRGLGSREGFRLVWELALALGGAVGASRAACDAGWIGREFQVGQTGRTVRPRLYVALGISGAVQHRVGMEHAGTILAVNSDPEAPIFEVADYAVVGDLFQVVPALIEAVRAVRTARTRAGAEVAAG